MCAINYVEEMNCFRRYAMNNQLTGKERLLWTALFWIANNRAVWDAQDKTFQWPDGFFSVTNSELFLESTLDKRSIEEVRNKLKQRGLIDFQKGDRNKKAPAYKLNFFSLNVGYKNVPNNAPSGVPNNTPSGVPNNTPNGVPKDDPIYINLSEDLYINNNIKIINNISADDDCGGAGESAFADFVGRMAPMLDEQSHCGEFALPEAVKNDAAKLTALLFLKFTDRSPTDYDRSLVCEHIAVYKPGTGYQIDRDKEQLLCYSFQQAVHKGNPGNWNYINGCMANLLKRNIGTLNQAEDFDESRCG